MDDGGHGMTGDDGEFFWCKDCGVVEHEHHFTVEDHEKGGLATREDAERHGHRFWDEDEE